jgi:hypothetical protein
LYEDRIVWKEYDLPKKFSEFPENYLYQEVEWLTLNNPNKSEYTDWTLGSWFDDHVRLWKDVPLQTPFKINIRGKFEL